MKTLYLLSSKEELREEGTGYENLSNDLYNVANNLLNFLSSKSNQMPAVNSFNQIESWNKSIEILVDYLLDFTLLGSGSYLSALKDSESIKDYHSNLIGELNKIEKMIDESNEKYIQNLKEEQNSE